MTIDEVVMLLKASQKNGLTPLQEIVLRSSWEGKTYTSIALEAHYGEERVRKVASNLWQLLSDFWGETINKANFRSSLEVRRLTKVHQQLMQEFNRTTTAVSLEFPSGPVSLNSRFYISRPPIEELAYAQIAEPGSLICIRASKKMGKTSLILRILAQASNQGFRTVSLDFQQAEKAVFDNLDRFLRWFCANVSRELQLEPKLNDYWDEEMGSKISCSIYFQTYLLTRVQTPLFLVLDEVDWLFLYPEIAADFLSLLRSWYEQAKRIEVWQKLRLVLVYSTEIMTPLKLTQSPFNIGLPIKLPNFTKEQVQELAQRHGLDWTDGKDADRLIAMVGGHPYLVRLALYHLVGKGGLAGNLQQLLQQAPTEAGIYHDYLRQYVLALREEPELGAAFLEVIQAKGNVKLEPEIAYKLQSMGLINVEGDRITPACKLYRLYLGRQLNSNGDLSNHRVEQLAKENQQLRVLSTLDELTQLANRRYFDTHLQIQWQKSAHKGTPLSLILCDIDYFKIYNKTYGYSLGDICLQQIAKAINYCVNHTCEHSTVLSASCRITYPRFEVLATHQTANIQEQQTLALVARYGGEEFAILSHANANTAVYIAEQIRQQVKALGMKCEYPGIGGLPATVLTVSLGVASIIPQEISDSNMLLDAAERALNQAKRQGRDRVVLDE